MKKFAINMLLTVVFISAAWTLAMRFDFLSAESNTAAGRSLAAQAAAAKDMIPLLLEAEDRYKRAYKLNPHDIVNIIEYAALEKELFLAAPALYRDRLDNSLDYYRKAFTTDPNNYIVNYEIGRNYAALWKYIGDEDKKYAVERLKNCLDLAPHYYDGVWQILASQPNNRELWKYRSEIFSKVKYGKKAYENGNMYWAGTLSRTIEAPQGKVLIKIKAKGEKARGVWPYMIVELDGRDLGGTFVDTAGWKEYRFTSETEGGSKVLNIIFPNDANDETKGEDRNLYVGEVRVLRNE